MEPDEPPVLPLLPVPAPVLVPPVLPEPVVPDPLLPPEPVVPVPPVPVLPGSIALDPEPPVADRVLFDPVRSLPLV